MSIIAYYDMPGIWGDDIGFKQTWGNSRSDCILHITPMLCAPCESAFEQEDTESLAAPEAMPCRSACILTLQWTEGLEERLISPLRVELYVYVLQNKENCLLLYV